MVTDSELVCRLREIVRSSDLRTTTASAVRRHLEKEFTVDLYGRRAFINQQIDIFLQNGSSQYDDQETGEVDQNVKNGVVNEGKECENQNACDRGQAISEEGVDEEEEGGNNYKIRQRKKRRLRNSKKKKKGGFCTIRALSPQLQKFVGVSELALTEVVKKIWAHARDKKLQDPKDKRRILCDESLRGIFCSNSIGMFEMSKELNKHIWPLDKAKASGSKSKKEKARMQRQYKVNMNFQAMMLSRGLAMHKREGNCRIHLIEG